MATSRDPQQQQKQGRREGISATGGEQGAKLRRILLLPNKEKRWQSVQTTCFVYLINLPGICFRLKFPFCLYFLFCVVRHGCVSCLLFLSGMKDIAFGGNIWRIDFVLEEL